MKQMFFLSLMLVISGCTSGPTYKDSFSKMTAVPHNRARITLFRTTESNLFIARKAPIELDGVKIGGVGYGGFISKDIDIGDHVLRSELWDSPGSCEVAFRIEVPGKEYFFEVAPRAEANNAFQQGATIFFPIITGMAALAEESRNNPCGGLFAIMPMPRNKAQAKLFDSQ